MKLLKSTIKGSTSHCRLCIVGMVSNILEVTMMAMLRSWRISHDLELTSWYDLSRRIGIQTGIMMCIQTVLFFEAAVSFLFPPEAGEVFDRGFSMRVRSSGARARRLTRMWRASRDRRRTASLAFLCSRSWRAWTVMNGALESIQRCVT